MKPKILFCKVEKCWICGQEFINIDSREVSWFWCEGRTPKEAYDNFIRVYGININN